MSLSDRGAPQDTAILRENMEQTIDVRGPGRYYPEEYGGQIQAIRQRSEIIADVPKTLAGIVLNYNEHALDSWQNRKGVELYDKHLTNQLLTENRRQQYDLEADIDIYETSKKLQSDIFEARKKVSMRGGGAGAEEQAVAEVLEKYKDIYQDRPAYAQKWQNFYKETGLTSLAQARKADLETDMIKVDNILNNEFSTALYAVKGLEQNPDGTYKPTVNIGNALNTFVKNISPLVKNGQIPINLLYNAMPTWYNQLVLGQAESYYQLFRDGDIDSDTLEGLLAGLREENLNAVASFTDENGQPLKDSNGKELAIDLSLDGKTQEELGKLYVDAKGGSDGGGEGIAKGAVDNFRKYVNWEEIQAKGYSNALLGMDSKELNNVFGSQSLAILKSTASDNTKAEELTNLYRDYRTCAMLIKVREAAQKMGKNASLIMTQIVSDIKSKLQTSRETTDWQNYLNKGFYITNDKGKPELIDLELGNAPFPEEVQQYVGTLGASLNTVFPRLGKDKYDALLYWQDTIGVLEKYNKYLSSNNPGEAVKQLSPEYNSHITLAQDNASPELIISKNPNSGKYFYDAKSKASINMRQHLIDAKKAAYQYGTKRAMPDSSIQEILDTKVNTIDNIDQKLIALQGIANNFVEAGCASDIYAFEHNQIAAGKEPGGLLSASMLYKTNSPDLRNVLANKANNGTYAKIEDSEKFKTNLENLENKTLGIFKKYNISLADRNALQPLVKWCAIAATKEDLKSIDTGSFENYLNQTLQGQFINLNQHFAHRPDWMGRTLFKDSIYKYSPAMEPYGNNINRLHRIGEEAYNWMKKNMGEDTPADIKTSIKNLQIIDDKETGTFRFVSNGERFEFLGAPVGLLYDSKDISDKVSEKELVNVLLDSLECFLYNGRYEDYKKAKERYRFAQGDYNVKVTSVLSKEEFDKRTALGLNRIKNNNTFLETCKKYAEAKNKAGALYSIE